jgi:tRNA(Arg) A34 adenosine deaminase TadA
LTFFLIFEANLKLKNMNIEFMRAAIEEGRKGMIANEGGPFGAVVVKDGQIIGRGHNQVLLLKDPTAHAEVMAIRDACKKLSDFQLADCELYTSCEPCPMCLGAIYWARPQAVYYACNRADAAAIDFDDNFIYHQVSTELAFRSIPFHEILRNEALELFRHWAQKVDKTPY